MWVQLLGVTALKQTFFKEGILRFKSLLIIIIIITIIIICVCMCVCARALVTQCACEEHRSCQLVELVLSSHLCKGSGDQTQADRLVQQALLPIELSCRPWGHFSIYVFFFF